MPRRPRPATRRPSQREDEPRSTQHLGSKRSSKHAPTETTSKRPVPRHRPVVDVPHPVARDPRFVSLSGRFSEHHFARAYSFIPALQRTEVDSLRASLSTARKQHAPFETIGSLERALKRTESAVEKARRDQRERDTLAMAKKEEQEKRKTGKGAWFMKQSEKRHLLLKAKFDDLAASGGQNAVRKAIDKRKKKIAQKEKKARPFSKAQAKAGGGSDEPDRKRRRI